jgi:uncharacterized protein (DUF1778 family)
VNSQEKRRLLLRLPPTLHAEVTWAAAAEGLSLNQFICNVLAGAVQWRAASVQPRYPRSSEELVAKMWRDLLG